MTNDGIGVVRNGVHCMGGDIYGDSDGNCRLTPEKMSGNPSTDCIKKVVSRIWSEVLGVENIDSASNFFELGGDSLQADRKVTLMRPPIAMIKGTPRSKAHSIVHYTDDRFFVNRYICCFW